MLHHRLWRRGHKVRVQAADIKETRTLAVLRTQDAESIPDVNETTAISDDGAIVALIVRHTLIPLARCVVRTVLEDIVHRGGGFVSESSLCLLVVIRGNVTIFVLDHLYNHFDAIVIISEFASLLSAVSIINSITKDILECV